MEPGLNHYGFAEIETEHGKEGVEFARKILSIFGESRGDEFRLAIAILNAYHNNEIVSFQEDMLAENLAHKILLRHAPNRTEENTELGFIRKDGKPFFVEIPSEHNLNSTDIIMQSIMAAGERYHQLVIDDPEKILRANTRTSMYRPFGVFENLYSYSMQHEPQGAIWVGPTMIAQLMNSTTKA